MSVPNEPVSPPQDPGAELTQLRVLWSSFFSMIGVLVGVTYVVEMPAGPPPEIMPMALGFVAMGLASLALFWAPRQLTPYRLLVVVRGALAEAIALNGFVLRFLGARPSLFFAFCGLAVVVLLLTAPNAEERARLSGGASPRRD